VLVSLHLPAVRSEVPLGPGAVAVFALAPLAGAHSLACLALEDKTH